MLRDIKLKLLKSRIIEKLVDCPDVNKTVIEDLIYQLHGLINQYDNLRKPTDLKSFARGRLLLYRIFLLQQELIAAIPTEQMSYFSEIRQLLQESLFDALNYEFAVYGIYRLNEAFLKEHCNAENIDAFNGFEMVEGITGHDSFPELLDRMPQPTVSKLLDMLLFIQSKSFDGGVYKTLKGLYDRNAPEYFLYQQFLRGHDIKYLGGNNSKNFKVTDKKTSKAYVLKVENTLNQTKTEERRLRRKLTGSELTVLKSERQATTHDGFERITRNIQVTEYCSQGDLYAIRTRFRGDDLDGIEASAANFYAQMAVTLKNIGTANSFFPDMKNSNWLVDDSDRVRIADTKSLVRTRAGKVEGSLIQTGSMIPPEFDSNKAFSASKAQAYLLGKNLYQYLTGCSDDELFFFDRKAVDDQRGKTAYLLRPYHEFNFSSRIFKTIEGKQFKALILGLMRHEPDERISLEDARIILEKIKLTKKWDALIRQRYAEPDSSEVIDQYSAVKKIIFQPEVTLEEALGIGEEMVNAIIDGDNDRADDTRKTITSLADSIEKEATFFTRGRKRHASEIKSSLRGMDRADVLSVCSDKPTQKASGLLTQLGKNGELLLWQMPKRRPCSESWTFFQKKASQKKRVDDPTLIAAPQRG